MRRDTFDHVFREPILIRLDTIIRLRWYAIAGQILAVLVVAFALGFPMPWAICLALILVSAFLNLFLIQRYKASHRLNRRAIFGLLAFDILHLGLLLYLTGGLQNPFSVFLMVPVVISATILQPVQTIVLGVLAIAVAGGLSALHWPLPWVAGTPFELPKVFVAGVFVAVVGTLAFTAFYVFRVAREAKRLADALAATELVLQREQHLSDLDGLAAAAAHELGTPLATIALVSNEMLKMVDEDSPLKEDALLLRSQAGRCREILQKLSSLSSDDEPIISSTTLNALLGECAEPLAPQEIDIVIEVDEASQPLPSVPRNPAVIYGLGNLIENAVDFASSKVLITLYADDEAVEVVINDDGPGFSDVIINQLGDPFVSQRSTKQGAGGLGLGFFIASTLLERNGADVSFTGAPKNSRCRAEKLPGACVVICWPRREIDIHMGQKDLADRAVGSIKQS